MSTAVCPDCDEKIFIAPDCIIDEIISCPNCGLELRIISLKPTLLEDLAIEGEDWGE